MKKSEKINNNLFDLFKKGLVSADKVYENSLEMPSEEIIVPENNTGLILPKKIKKQDEKICYEASAFEKIGIMPINIDDYKIVDKKESLDWGTPKILNGQFPWPVYTKEQDMVEQYKEKVKEYISSPSINGNPIDPPLPPAYMSLDYASEIYEELLQEYNEKLTLDSPIIMTSDYGFLNVSATYKTEPLPDGVPVFQSSISSEDVVPSIKVVCDVKAIKEDSVLDISHEEKIALHRIRQELNGLFEALKGCSFLVSGSFFVKKMLEFYKGEKVNWDNGDIDIFPYFDCDEKNPKSSQNAQNNMIYMINALKKYDNPDTSKSFSMKYNTPFGKIDFICLAFSSPENILDNFDFMHNMIGMTSDRVYLEQNNYFDKMNCLHLIKNQELLMHKHYSLRRTIKRAIKYANRGFYFREQDLNILTSAIRDFKNEHKDIDLEKEGSGDFIGGKYIEICPVKICSVPFEPAIFDEINNRTEEKDYSFLEI